MIIRKMDNLRFAVVLDSYLMQEDFMFDTVSWQFNVYKRKRVPVRSRQSLFGDWNYNKGVIKVGFLKLFYDNYKELLTEESMKLLVSEIFSDKLIEPLPNLTDQQNHDVRKLSRYKRAIDQSFTGSGKTEVICSLADAYAKQGKKVFIMSPSYVAMNELKKRLQKFGYPMDYEFDQSQLINLANVNGNMRTEKFQTTDPYWKEVKLVLADEVEKCINADIESYFEEMENFEHIFGFSATAEKYFARKIITLPNGEQKVNDTILSSSKMIGLFGFTEAYHKPEEKEVIIKEVYCYSFGKITDNRDVSAFDRNFSIKAGFDIPFYNRMIFRHPAIGRLVHKVCVGEGKMYVPLNEKKVLDRWIENEFFNDKVLMISSAGYQICYLGERTNIDYGQIAETIESGEVDFLFGTSSSFNSIDFNGGINKVLLLNDRISTRVLQQIGRVSRGKHYEIFMLKPQKKLNFYDRLYSERFRMLKEYYSDCDLSFEQIAESDYDVE